MKNFFPAEWSFITPHKQGDFVRVGNMQLKSHVSNPVLLDDGRVLFPGQKKSEYYDPKTRKFYLIDNNEFTLVYDSSEAIKLKNGNILLIGGCGTNKIASNEYSKTLPNTYIFNIKTNIFVYGPNMISGRQNHNAILLNDGKIFIAGGKYIDYSWNTHSYNVMSTEFYNPKTNKFEKGPELPVEMPLVSKIIQLKNNDMYIYGCTFVSEYNCEERIYKLANGSDLFEYIDKFPCHNSDIYKLKSEEIITFCGISGNNETVNKIVIFDPKTNKIRQTSLNLPDYFDSKTVLLPDDKLLFVGNTTGYATGYKSHKDVRLYDFKTGTLSLLPNELNVPRTKFLYAVTLKDGNLLIAGGERLDPKYYSAEIYMLNDKIEK